MKAQAGRGLDICGGAGNAFRGPCHGSVGIDHQIDGKIFAGQPVAQRTDDTGTEVFTADVEDGQDVGIVKYGKTWGGKDGTSTLVLAYIEATSSIWLSASKARASAER
jgi:hypothetical protein